MLNCVTLIQVFRYLIRQVHIKYLPSTRLYFRLAWLSTILRGSLFFEFRYIRVAKSCIVHPSYHNDVGQEYDDITITIHPKSRHSHESHANEMSHPPFKRLLNRSKPSFPIVLLQSSCYFLFVNKVFFFRIFPRCLYNKKSITRLPVNLGFFFECSTRRLTRSLRSPVRIFSGTLGSITSRCFGKWARAPPSKTSLEAWDCHRWFPPIRRSLGSISSRCSGKWARGLDVMSSGLDVVSNGWSVVIFSEGPKMFRFPIVKPSSSFTDIKTITIPAICSENNSGLLWTFPYDLVHSRDYTR